VLIDEVRPDSAGREDVCDRTLKVEPDILVMAKGIADGFPLSGFIAREEIADSFKPGDHLSTFGGNPVSCAAALANVTFMEEQKLVDQARKKGEFLKAQLEALKAKHKMIGEVRGKGLMIGVELVRVIRIRPQYRGARSGFLPGSKSLLVGLGGVFGNVVRIQPPAVITQTQMELDVEDSGSGLQKVV
jgi:4-aminobutyrate aminotransferase-like enzyme